LSGDDESRIGGYVGDGKGHGVGSKGHLVAVVEGVDFKLLYVLDSGFSDNTDILSELGSEIDGWNS